MSEGMWPEPVQRVATYLAAAAVEATIQEFPEGTPTAEAAAEAAGCRLEQIVKSLVFVCDDSYVLALVPGDRRADAVKVAAAARAQEARVAKADEVVAATGAAAVYMERTLLQHGVVWIGAGSPAHMASLSPGDLQQVAGARTADLVARR
jgi:prolyl-tRNA editing enzyme YbaK/EbsC (Cys-tRNA(Pro) deacylase)